jgi:hypothetical protein
MKMFVLCLAAFLQIMFISYISMVQHCIKLQPSDCQIILNGCSVRFEWTETSHWLTLIIQIFRTCLSVCLSVFLSYIQHQPNSFWDYTQNLRHIIKDPVYLFFMSSFLLTVYLIICLSLFYCQFICSSMYSLCLYYLVVHLDC